MRRNKPNRKRTIRKLFFLSDEEEEILRSKMAEGGYTDFSAFMRKQLINVHFFVADDSERIRVVTVEVNKIGNRINDIAHNVNVSGTITSDELEEVKDGLVDVWQYLKFILSGEKF